MVRRLAVAAAVCLLTVPLGASALGLGDLTVHSALNEPLRAEIGLLSARGEDPSRIQVSLASKSAFQRAGLDRPFVLSQLDFKVVEGPRGRPQIKITSNKAIREPFLNFLVEINWPEGRLLRQYTALLDPPTYMAGSPSQPAASQSAQRTAAPAPEPQRQAQRQAQREPRTGGGVRTSGPGVSGSGGPAPETGEYTTQANDTLWSIAEEVRPGRDVSIEQTMLALFRTNPDAFYRDNINALERGKVLRVPDRAEIKSLSRQEAVRQVRRYATQWREFRQRLAAESGEGPTQVAQADTGEPADGTAEATGETGGQAGASGGQLDVVAPDEAAQSGDSQGTEGAAAGSGRVDQQLATLQEELHAATQENESLRTRMAELEAQVQKMQQRLALKNEELAALQQQASAGDAPQSGPAGDAEAGEQPAEEPDAAAPGEQQVAMAEQGADQGADQTGTDQAAGDSSVPTPEVGPEALGDEAAEPAGEPARVSADADGNPYAAEYPKVEPREQPPAASAGDSAANQGIVARVMANLRAFAAGTAETVTADPMRTGMFGAVAVLLVGLAWMVVRRRRMQAEGFQESILQEQPASAPAASGGASSGPASAPKDDSSSFLSDFAVSDIGAMQTDVSEADPIAEADVYMAYGRHQQAADLLTDALNDNPERRDLQGKLFEVYHAGGLKDAFVQQAETLRESVGDDDPLWQDVYAKGQDLAPEHPLFGGSGEPAAGGSVADEPALSTGGDFGAPGGDEGDDEFDFEAALASLGGGETNEANATPAAQGTTAEGPSEEPSGGESSGGEIPDAFEFDLSDFEVPDFGAESGGEDDGEHRLGTEGEAAASGNDQSLDFDLDGLDLGESASSDSSASATGSSETDDNTLDFSTMDLDMDLDTSAATDESSQPVTAEPAGPAEERSTGGGDQGGIAAFGDDALAPNLGGGEEEDLDAFSDLDEVGTKLDLARAYIDMGDEEGARGILDEVMDEGSDDQKREAEGLKQQLP